MPREKFTNHKGRSRTFTNHEELEEQRRKNEEEREWKKARKEWKAKAKAVSNLIKIENPNRVQKKTKKVTALNTQLAVAKPELSRREREVIEKQRAKKHYQRLHAEGKTEQARADLARLAIIKEQREDAQKRREKEKKDKEDAAKQRTAQIRKALGKET